MGDLPTGTVTFLFTDVEGSTRLLHELGAESYAAALQEHRRVLREAFSLHGGVEVDTQGDAFFVAFPSAPEAAAAAEDVQAALAEGPIHVRMGLHTGTPAISDEGYAGLDVHLGARVAACGHGGQVLLSKATMELVERELTDLGEHRLKDFEQPVWLYQLGDGRFPPLKTISNTNLPRPASSFVGRESEVAEAVSLLRGGARLVTLTGPGGSGKTRLAIEAASEVVGEFRNGVFWVGLATLRDPELVLPTVGEALGAQGELTAHIGERELLLLLDNLEQVVDVAPALARLVEACPNLALLTTSRELLRVRGEVEYEVLPMADPDAVELFCIRSGLKASRAMAELCRRLDNMPLALELAAARTKALSLEQILDRLSQRLDLFKGGRDADPRQQTLRATIEWSHDLLGREEERLFARLAVFAGGCTLEAAETVCDADLDTLQSLVEKSLSRHTSERFWMLETIRDFSREQLGASGEGDALRRRHAQHYHEIAEAANLSLDSRGRRAPQRHELVIGEQDNLRAAIDWATDADVELGLRLAVAMENFWITHDPREGLRRFEALLAAPDVLDRTLLARAWRDCGGCAQMASSHERAREAYEQSLELYRVLGDESGVATVIFRLGVDAHMRGDLEDMRRLYGESHEIFQRLGDAIGELQVLGNLGGFEFEQGNRELGRELAERSLALGREAGWTWWEASQLASLAEMELESGRVEAGAARAKEALAITRRLGDRRHMVWALAAFARAAAERGDEERAALLWTGVEAEESRGPIMGWDEQQRDRFASHIPDLPRSRPGLSLEEAVEYALSVDSRS